MAQAGLSDDDAKQLVEDMLDRLLEVVVRTAGGTVDQAVPNWWRSHYRGNFFYAIRVKGKSCDNDWAMLERKAEELGQAARRLAGAGPITTLHAALASFEVDCPPTAVLEDWCN